jgi:hypothetical protein
MRPLRGSSMSYMDKDLDEPGVGKPFPNAIERTLYFNYSCPRGDAGISIEVKKAVYTNPQIIDISPEDSASIVTEN